MSPEYWCVRLLEWADLPEWTTGMSETLIFVHGFLFIYLIRLRVAPESDMSETYAVKAP